MPFIEQETVDQLRRSLLEALTALDSVRVVDRKPEPETIAVNKYKKLIYKESWPRAIANSLLCPQDSDRERLRRCDLILSQTLEKSIEGKKILDLSCKNGDLSYAALSHKPTVSRGYDVVRGGWNRFPDDTRLRFSTNLNELWDDAPYDAIFLWESLDWHEDPVNVLSTAKDLLAPGGLIYVRTRPWSSRYGMHDVRSLNKAFAHLYFEDHELSTMGIKPSPHKVIRYETYHDWFEESNLKIRKCILTKHQVENVFKTPVMSPRLLELYGTSDFPEELLRVSHVDYTLEEYQ